jgi:hypothetical protein
MTPLVKMRLERPAGRDKREIKNDFSAEYAQSASGGHLKSFCSAKAPPSGELATPQALTERVTIR